MAMQKDMMGRAVRDSFAKLDPRRKEPLHNKRNSDAI